MRIGFLGAVETRYEQLAEVIPFLLDTLRVSEVIYLAEDRALDEYISNCHEKLTQGEAGATCWSRSLRCVRADYETIDAHLDQEQTFSRLSKLSSLNHSRVRMLAFSENRRALACFDRRLLSQETIQAASVIVFGRGESPLVKQTGEQFWLCPGALSEAGLLVLEDEPRTLRLGLFDRSGRQLAQHQLTTKRQEGAS